MSQAIDVVSYLEQALSHVDIFPSKSFHLARPHPCPEEELYHQAVVLDVGNGQQA
ncbi:hypothetical protein D3C77_731130 [compost metagenome]